MRRKDRRTNENEGKKHTVTKKQAFFEQNKRTEKGDCDHECDCSSSKDVDDRDPSKDSTLTKVRLGSDSQVAKRAIADLRMPVLNTR